MRIGQHHHLHATILPGAPPAPRTDCLTLEVPASDVAQGVYNLADFSRSDIGDAAAVVGRYADMRIGLADASIVVLAARYQTTRLLTFDERRFRAIKPLHAEAFTILPADC